MKKIIILVAFIFLSIATISQTKYGVRAGMSLSANNFAQALDCLKQGIHIGGVADIPLGSSKFSFVPGVYLADKGTKIEGYFYSVSVNKSTAGNNNHYINSVTYNYQLEIPLLFTYKIPINEKLSLKPQLGAFVSYTMFGRINEKIYFIVMESPTSNIETSKDYYFYDDIYFGFGGNIGLSAFYNKYSFTLSCDVGYSNHPTTIKFIYPNNNYPDICMFFSLGYNF